MPPPILNPKDVSFLPSPDHDVIDFAGTPEATPRVTSYELVIANSALPPQDLGKPAPIAGRITTPLPPLPQGNAYLPKVTVVGPGGRSPVALGPSFGYVAAPTAASDVQVS